MTRSRLTSTLLPALALLAAFASARAQDVTVRGTVRGPDGRPVGLAEILVNDSSRARTDSAGAFSIGGLPAGATELTVRRVGFAPLSLPLTLTAGQRRTLAIELAPLPFALEAVVVSAARQGLFGKVVDTWGNALVGVNVTVLGAGRAAATSATGEFGIASLPPRPYVVVVKNAGYYAARFSVIVPPDRGQELQISLEPIDPSVTGSARRVAEGTHRIDEMHMRDLDRRLSVNPVTLLPRSLLAKEGDRPVMELLSRRIDDMVSLANSSRGATSLTDYGVRAPAAASGAGASSPNAPPSMSKLAAKGQICTFVDGEYALGGMRGFLNSAPTAWIESIELSKRDLTGTLSQRLPMGVFASDCALFVVIWLR